VDFSAEINDLLVAAVGEGGGDEGEAEGAEGGLDSRARGGLGGQGAAGSAAKKAAMRARMRAILTRVSRFWTREEARRPSRLRAKKVSRAAAAIWRRSGRGSRRSGASTALMYSAPMRATPAAEAALATTMMLVTAKAIEGW
jgi:hypothetical protein